MVIVIICVVTNWTQIISFVVGSDTNVLPADQHELTKNRDTVITTAHDAAEDLNRTVKLRSASDATGTYHLSFIESPHLLVKEPFWKHFYKHSSSQKHPEKSGLKHTRSSPLHEEGVPVISDKQQESEEAPRKLSAPVYTPSHNIESPPSSPEAKPKRTKKTFRSIFGRKSRATYEKLDKEPINTPVNSINSPLEPNSPRQKVRFSNFLMTTAEAEAESETSPRSELDDKVSSLPRDKSVKQHRHSPPLPARRLRRRQRSTSLDSEHPLYSEDKNLNKFADSFDSLHNLVLYIHLVP